MSFANKNYFGAENLFWPKLERWAILFIITVDESKMGDAPT